MTYLYYYITTVFFGINHKQIIDVRCNNCVLYKIIIFAFCFIYASKQSDVLQLYNNGVLYDKVLSVHKSYKSSQYVYHH